MVVLYWLIAFPCKATVFIKKGHHETKRLRNKYSNSNMANSINRLDNIYLLVQNGGNKCGC